ncbi:uncharacterized protein LOC100185347 [Ciona intestinalis]
MKIFVLVLCFLCVALVESQFAGLALQRPCTVCQTGVSSLQLNLPCLNSLIPGLQSLQGGQTCQQFAQCVAIPGSYGRGFCQCYTGYTAVLYSCIPNGQQAITSLITQLINRRPTSTGPTITANYNCRPQCNLANSQCELRSTTTSQTFACGCKTGFQGNGYNCIRSQIAQGKSKRLFQQLNGYIIGNNSVIFCTARCDPVNAICVYSQGSTTNVCRCKPGFTGDGVQCTAIPGYVASRCQPNCHATLGQCVYNRFNAQYECQCRLGYRGNGYACFIQTPTNTGNVGTPQRTCTQRCHPRLARCNYLPLPNEYRCQCNGGYTGNGLYCVPDVTPVPVSSSRCVLPCHRTLASCVYNSIARQFDCLCNQGYRGNGVSCVPEAEVVPEGTGPYCVPACDSQYGVCQFNNALRRHECSCVGGYEGNGITCTRISTTTCQRQCHPTAASCSYSSSYRRYRCQCNTGYFGDGVRCAPVFIPTSFTPVVYRCQPPCSALATCVLNPTTQQRTCECLDGYSSDGQTCTSNGPGNGGGGKLT